MCDRHVERIDALSAALDAACARIAEYTGCPSVSGESWWSTRREAVND